MARAGCRAASGSSPGRRLCSSSPPRRRWRSRPARGRARAPSCSSSRPMPSSRASGSRSSAAGRFRPSSSWCRCSSSCPARSCRSPSPPGSCSARSSALPAAGSTRARCRRSSAALARGRPRARLRPRRVAAPQARDWPCLRRSRCSRSSPSTSPIALRGHVALGGLSPVRLPLQSRGRLRRGRDARPDRPALACRRSCDPPGRCCSSCRSSACSRCSPASARCGSISARARAAYRGTALLLGDVVEADDAYTGSHSRGRRRARRRGRRRLGSPPPSAATPSSPRSCTTSARSQIPNEIINKPGPLDHASARSCNTHTIEGERMLERVGGVLARRRPDRPLLATSAATATAIPTAWPATRSRSWRDRVLSATRSAR